MEYVLNILRKEKAILEKCLNEWESKEYPLAKKERDDKLWEVEIALETLCGSKVCSCSRDSYNTFDEMSGLCGTCGGHGW
jgi:hypothetical protein